MPEVPEGAAALMAELLHHTYFYQVFEMFCQLLHYQLIYRISRILVFLNPPLQF
jgi:hypothetical protein